MHRILALLAVPLLALGLAACGDDDSTTSAAADKTTTTASGAKPTTTAAPDTETTETTETGQAAEIVLTVADTSLGTVLVDTEGYTLYFFDQDTEDAAACTEGCAQAWPPLPWLNDGTVGDGADASLLGVADRADGSMQATYNGHRLYTYSGDKAAGDTTGNGVGGVWHAVTPAGEAVVA